MNSVFNFNNIKKIFSGRIPGQVIIQYTDRCNATCPQCNMRRTSDFQRHKIPKEEVIKIIDACSKNSVQALSFTGGETFLYQDELLELIKYATSKGIPLIRTGTNAFFLMNYEAPDFDYKINKLAEDLAKTNLRNLWISIDSMDPDTHEKMRGLPGVIKGIEKALPIFHKNGIYPAANLGINRNTGGEGKIPSKMEDEKHFYYCFREAFKGFYDFVIGLGFTMTNVCYPMNIEKSEENGTNPIYGASSPTNIVSFNSQEKVQIFSALKDTIIEYRDKIKIFTPLVSLYSLIKEYQGDLSYPKACRGGVDFFFIDSNTINAYPCGFRGDESFGKYYNIDMATIDKNPYCKLCDWECFRDPSEQIGFLIDILQNPIKAIKNRDKEYRKLWIKDLLYYKKCNFFDGRIL